MTISSQHRLLLRAAALVAMVIGIKLCVHFLGWAIRETSFISAGYLLADITTILLCIGLVLARIEPFYESLFFVSVISYLMIFLLMLIRDLDNPFGYYERFSGADVSLKPLADTAQRLARSASVEATAPAGSPGPASSAV